MREVMGRRSDGSHDGQMYDRLQHNEMHSRGSRDGSAKELRGEFSGACTCCRNVTTSRLRAALSWTHNFLLNHSASSQRCPIAI